MCRPEQPVEYLRDPPHPCTERIGPRIFWRYLRQGQLLLIRIGASERLPIEQYINEPMRGIVSVVRHVSVGTRHLDFLPNCVVHICRHVVAIQVLEHAPPLIVDVLDRHAL
ncbi:hypothetical protein D3C72_2079320 [compost metagenome]